MRKSKMINKTIHLSKSKNISNENRQEWGMSLLTRLLTELCNESKGGSIYAENPSEEPGFKLTINKEKVLHKVSPYRVIAPDQSSKVNAFIGFINGVVFEQSPATMAAGVLEVVFDDEETPRRFTVFSRRSSALGDFIQIDQFGGHL